MPFPAPVAPSPLARLIVSGRRWVVLAMLLALHMALISEPGAFQRLWLLVHFGFFLLWQPFFATERELDVFSVALLLAVVVATLYFLSGWMMVAWLLVLIGILGGRVFTVQAARRSRFYLVAFGYVLTVLLMWAIPALLLGEQELPERAALFAQRFLPLVLLPLAFLPLLEERDAGQVFDFFYAMLVFQLGVVLVLGSIVMMRFTDEDYAVAVSLTVLAFGLALFAFAVLWNPMRGFGGLGTYFSSYLMSVGLPFELWMRRIAELSETQADPRIFLEQSLQEVASLPWMQGGQWISPDGEGRFGKPSGHATRFQYHQLAVTFHTEGPLSPALFLHMRLLAQVVGEFYEGKRRESALRQHSYLQAVHETGARLTHDVKNLLQSLYTLTSVAPKESADGYVGLLQRQLPQLTQRLHATLEKLRSPEVGTVEMPVRAHVWWRETQRRFAGEDVKLESDIQGEGDIPAALFDSFVENTLDNARAKEQRGASTRVAVRFAFNAQHVELSVEDDGAALAESVTRYLFARPVERSTGMGIGLFHVARFAAQAGYTVALATNRDGEVRFTLSRDVSGARNG